MEFSVFKVLVYQILCYCYVLAIDETNRDENLFTQSIALLLFNNIQLVSLMLTDTTATFECLKNYFHLLLISRLFSNNASFFPNKNIFLRSKPKINYDKSNGKSKNKNKK